MTNIYLKSAVALQALKNRFVARTRDVANGESGASLVELVVLTAIILAGCIIVGGLIITALKTQGNTTANCIKGANNASSNCGNFSK